MEPDADLARCPVCGRAELATQLPLFVLVGASGAGKTTLFPLLLDRLRGECMVFDVDWLIDPLSGAADSLRDDQYWDMLRDTWLHVAHAVAQNGLATLLVGPIIPQHLTDLRGSKWVREVSYAVLDCSAAQRRDRIERRPPWRARDVNGQQQFADWLRSNLTPVIDTSDATPHETADAVAAWVRQQLP